MARSKWLFAAAVIVYLIGAGLAFYTLSVLKFAVPVEAVIVSHDIERRRNSDNETRYKPIVKFSFLFDGSPYVGENIRPGITQSYGTRFMAENAMTDFPVGKNLTAYAPKDNPGAAFLIPEPSFISILFVMAAPVFICAALFTRLSAQPPLPGESLMAYTVVWPIVILLTGATVAVPWTMIVEGAILSKVAIWALTAATTVAPLFIVNKVKNRSQHSDP